MKSNLPMALLVGALILGASTNAFMAVRCFFSIREMERIQAQIYQNSRVLNTFEAMVNDALRYSKSNPAILPILDQLESRIKLRTNAPAYPVGRSPMTNPTAPSN